MKIIISGDRHWDDVSLVARVILLLDPSKDVVIEGEADGVDKIARREAEKRGIKVDPTPANWKKYGKAAGYIRNREMLDKGGEFLICIHDDIKNSKGTRNMENQARSHGVPRILVDHWNTNQALLAIEMFLREKRKDDLPTPDTK